jgi:ADP-ribose pyrophosphatase YjhB (NUDIX family)
MHLAANVFDVWTFRRRGAALESLLLYTSVEKAARHFNGGRFWQIPSDFVNEGESVTDAISRVLERYGLRPNAIWAGEPVYLIYDRRFAEMQAIGVYAAEVGDATVRLNPSEHSERLAVLRAVSRSRAPSRFEGRIAFRSRVHHRR